MRLDPKKVKFISPFIGFYLKEDSMPFLGKGANIQLLETALVIEGLRLKVSLLGLERLLSKVMSEWSSLTIPYSRIHKAYQVNWPFARWASMLMFTMLMILFLVFLMTESWFSSLEILLVSFLGMALAAYIFFRTPKRYVIIYKNANQVRRTITISISSSKLSQEFHQRLTANRQSARSN